MSESVKCLWCNGSGKDGQDRCYPPNDIICYLCSGCGKCSPKRNEVMKFISGLMYPQSAMISFTGLIAAMQYYDSIVAPTQEQTDVP